MAATYPKPEFWLVRSTHETPDHPVARRFHDVYLFDRSVATHCAELTPSYEMNHLYSDAELKEGIEDEDGEIRTDLECEWTQHMELVEYWHCRSLEPKLDDERDDVSLVGSWDAEAGLEKDDYDDLVEEVIEYHRGNRVL